MKPVQLDAEAKQELSKAFRWYEARRAGLGFDFLEEVESVLLALEELPGIGALVPGVSTGLPVRRVLAHRFPYIVVFLEMEEEIRVLAIAHERREPGYWVKRIERR